MQKQERLTEKDNLGRKKFQKRRKKVSADRDGEDTEPHGAHTNVDIRKPTAQLGRNQEK